MNDSDTTQQQELSNALDRFEASVETPFVPGEMEHWMTAVESEWNRLLPILTWLITTRHPRQYEEIQKEDDELIHRVQQLRKENTAIEASAIKLEQQIALIKSAVSAIEPDEARIKSTMEDFVEDSIKLIIRIRKQERAIRTWLLEAFTRDRGVVD